MSGKADAECGIGSWSSESLLIAAPLLSQPQPLHRTWQVPNVQ